jgi:phosphoribosylformimino-5-aminoimidazole carboxamide ribotide isomerase
MLILPAIDLQNGRCVRLLRGDFDAATRYGDPFDQVRAFADAGAAWVHIVDLDGAKAGAPVQHDLIAGLAKATSLRVQCGGGVRDRNRIEALLNAGAARVVVGSAAVQRPVEVRAWIREFGVERVCVALDVRAAPQGWEIAVHGWAKDAGKSLASALDDFPPGALKHVLVTDISRDGALAGPNIDLMQRLLALRRDLDFQASGGVSSIDDLSRLKTAGAPAVIVGRALYENRFSLEAALAL